MTRDAGQLSTRQAIVGILAILAVVASVVAALALLLERDEQLPPLEAPAEPGDAAGQRCPARARPMAPVSSEELIECPQAYDGLVVHYRGEAVRAVLRRGDRAWVHLNDDPYALDLGPLPAHRTAVGGNSGIPVSVPGSVADEISYVGDGRHRGDVLDVVGTFRRAHPADDGGPAIHAHTGRVAQPGHPLRRPVSGRRTAVALVVLALAAAAATAVRLRPL